MVSVMLMIWFERKLHADMTNRMGPTITGPFGLLQTLADGIKLFFKEDLLPSEGRGDSMIFRLAPYLTLIPAFLIFTVVPIGGDFDNADGKIGILFVLAMSSLAVYGIMLAGWSSGSKYPLFASVRASAQMVSYEAALGLSLVAVLIKSGTLSTHDIVAGQADGWNWNLWITGFIPFIVFLIATTAELNRPPFDLVEAEQEIVGGFHTEYSSIRFALFFLGEYMNVVTMSAIMVTLFFGGPDGPIPFFESFGWILAFCFTFIWFRAALPRFRYDQLMDLGWKLLIPLSLGWIVALVALDIGVIEGWNRPLVAVICFAGLMLMGVLLNAAVQNGKRKQLAGEGFD
ncbi:UNVERIFIED_CONTAM: hypothetical protein GTU68_037970 [Idotea baltica]|nr:hypothetical protein [Idotea baltica]